MGKVDSVDEPASPHGPRRDAASSGLRGVLDGLRVVIVDDDDDARDLLQTVLVQRSACVFDAASASKAFELLKRERPDVLISDIAMPEEDGYMLIGRVRALPEEQGGRTAAIAVTAYAGRADRNRALAAGFDAHYAKPIDLEALIARLLEIRSALALGQSPPRDA